MPKSNNFSKILILRERTKEVYGISCQQICSISKFFHKSKRHNSFKNGVIFFKYSQRESLFLLTPSLLSCLFTQICQFAYIFNHSYSKNVDKQLQNITKLLELIIFVQKRH